jgi:hypothetical protein
MLTPIEQIQCHEDQVLKMYNIRIMNVAPASLDSQLVGRMKSISFWCNYTAVVTKKNPKRFFLFDVGKIISVESGISNKCATIKVDYNENDRIFKVYICLNSYVSNKVKIPKKCYQWRLLEIQGIMWLEESRHHRERVVISLGDPLPLIMKKLQTFSIV